MIALPLLFSHFVLLLDLISYGWLEKKDRSGRIKGSALLHFQDWSSHSSIPSLYF